MSEIRNYVKTTLANGTHVQHKRVLEMQKDCRRHFTGKRITTYNQYRKSGGKNWTAFKNHS